MDSLKRAAAFPVGATKRIVWFDSNCNNNNSLVTVVVLPVPGPPVIIASFLPSAVAVATLPINYFGIVGRE